MLNIVYLADFCGRYIRMEEIQRQYKDVLPYSGYMAIGTILTLVSVLGSIQNFGCVYIFYKRRILQRPTNYFVINLAVLDFIMSIFGIPMAAVASFNTRWIFGEKGCIYYGFLMTLMGFNNITVLSIIAVNRYIVIVKPQHRIHRRSAIFMILASFVSSFVMASLPLIGWSSYTLEGAGISCSVNWKSNDSKDVSISVLYMILYYLIPVTIILFSYISIYKKVKRDTCNPNQVSGRNTNAEYDVAKVMFAIICAFIVSWCPYAIVSAWSAFGNPSDIPPSATVIPLIMAKLSVIWNPIIYIIKNRNFRAAIVVHFPCFARCFFIEEIRVAAQTPADSPPNRLAIGSNIRENIFLKPIDQNNSHNTVIESDATGGDIERPQQRPISSDETDNKITSDTNLDLCIGGVWVGQDTML